MTRLRALASTFLRFLPGLPELVPTQLTILLVLIPLCGYRATVGRFYDPKAGSFELAQGELQFWLPTGLIVAVILGLAKGRLKVALQFVFHGLCWIFLLLSGAELAFYAVTGTRVDWDALGFLLGDIQNVAPVALSELRPQHVVAGIAGLIACFAPMTIRLRSRPRWELLVAMPALLMTIWLATGGRKGLRPPLKEFQPSLSEQLFWDGLDRYGDVTTPPTPADVVPRVVTAVAGVDRPNVVLILLESVGWQSTSFGGQFDTTPNLARFGQGGLVADHMYSVIPHTSKALVTTMCGDWPMLRTDIGESRPGGVPDRCLPNLLRDLGYSTGFFQPANERFESRTELIHQFGFQFFRGRSTLVDAPDAKQFAIANYFGLEDRAMLKPSVDWASRQTKPWFAAYLTLATHHDYAVLPDWDYPPMGDKTGNELHYLNDIRYSDDFVNRLYDAYDALGLAKNTVFIVLGDHGEAFGQHGRSIHDMVIYDEGLHIPFVMWGPGVPVGRVSGDRQQIDILPTVVGLTGGTLSGSVRGASLLGPVPDRVLHHSCWRSHRCLAERTPAGMKTIDLYEDGPMQLFDILHDPLELTALRLPSVTEARTRLRAWRDAVNGRYDEVLARWRASMQRPDDTPATHHWPLVDGMGCQAAQDYAVPGQTFWLQCRWRATSPIKQSLRVSVRFDDETASVRPFQGSWPTWKWNPGWTVDDSVPVHVPDNATAGTWPIDVSWDDSDWASVAQMRVLPDPASILPDAPSAP